MDTPLDNQADLLVHGKSDDVFRLLMKELGKTAPFNLSNYNCLPSQLFLRSLMIYSLHLVIVIILIATIL